MTWSPSRRLVWFVSGAVCLLAAVSTSTEVLAQVSPSGPQFQVNTYTNLDQRAPRIGALATGAFVVVWHSYGSNGTDHSLYSIQARRFNPKGVPAGSGFQVNSYTTGEQRYPAVATVPSGGFVVVWQSQGSNGTDTFDYSIQARLFAPDGTPLGDQFQVNTFTSNAQRNPSVASDSQGGFVVVWNSQGSAGSDNSGLSVQAQMFDAAGLPLGGQFQVNSYTTFDQEWPSVSVDDFGRFVVAWAGPHIQAQRFEASGVPAGAAFQVNDYTTGSRTRPSVASSDDGRLVIAWQSGGSSGGDSDGFSIQARRFDAEGVALGASFQVNSYSTGDQVLPRVTSDAAGGFVVAWQSPGSFGSDSDFSSIQARQFKPSGGAASGEFQANTVTSGTQLQAAVASDSLGNFIVAWSSYSSGGTDSSGFSIQAQRFDALFRDGFESGGTSRWSAAVP